ncbi:MAG: glycosyltransferase [Prolixibacteraceae bacterium]
MDKLVSIIVTSYNHLEYLPQRMESLLAQTYPHTEIIVVDDGSGDGSQEYLKKFKDHPNIRLFLHESNQGYVHASNYGAGKASSEFVIFAECDDFSHPDQIALLYQAITTNHNVGVVFSESNLVDEKGIVQGSDYQFRNKSFQKLCQGDQLIPGKVAQRLMLLTNLIPNMSAAMFRKSRFEIIGGLSEKYRLSADYDFWIRMAGVTDFYYLKQPLNNFRSHVDAVRIKQGTSVQLIEKIEIIAPLKKGIKLSRKEIVEIQLNLGDMWLNYAISELDSFLKSFVTVLNKTLRLEPFLLLFLLINCPIKLFKKIAKLVSS